MITRHALTPLQAAAVALGAILLGHALEISNGFYSPVALAGVVIAAACVLAGALRLPAPRGTERLVAGVLTAGFISNIVALATMPVGFYLAQPQPAGHPAFLAGLAGAVLFALLIAFDPPRARRAWFPALLVTYGLLGIWLIHASPRPRIDVVTVFRESLDALARLESPYSVTFPNIYGDASLYGPGLVVDGRVQFGFPYPPLSLIMAVPAYALRLDLRYAELAALFAGAAWIGGASRGRIAPLAAALLLFTPRTFFVLEQAWTESLVLCWVGLVVYAAHRAAARRDGTARRGARALALGLLIASKQHLAIALLFTGWLGRNGEGSRDTRARLAGAAAVAAAITVPFFVWDPGGFWRSVVLLQFGEPFRMDSLSLLSHWAHNGWIPNPGVVLAAPLAALAAGLAIAWWRLPRTPAGFALGIGVAFLLLFLFSKKAFCNYYFLVIGFLAAAVAAASRDFPPDAGGGTGAPQPLAGGGQDG